jgi:HD superfamily phosphohydrolase
MHAVEDYIVSRYQMYMQVYFHPASRAMEVLLHQLLHRAKVLYPDHKEFFERTSPRLVPFLEGNFDLCDYLHLDDGVMNTYFQLWEESADAILSDLATSFVDRHIFKSVKYEKIDEPKLDILRQIVASTGFNPDYYTGVNSNFDLPYDFYRPSSAKPRTQIEILQQDGSLVELSKLSSLVEVLAGTTHGDSRFYFPREIISDDHLFSEAKTEFEHYIKNGEFQP